MSHCLPSVTDGTAARLAADPPHRVAPPSSRPSIASSLSCGAPVDGPPRRTTADAGANAWGVADGTREVRKTSIPNPTRHGRFGEPMRRRARNENTFTDLKALSEEGLRVKFSAG